MSNIWSDVAFQSTLPQGKWQVGIRHTDRKESSFNPHFRKGSDYSPSFLRSEAVSFNPHFRKGSDIWMESLHFHLCRFNPHFRKGSDLDADNNIILSRSFNPHFRKGSDIKACNCLWLYGVSIHTSAREVTTSNVSPGTTSCFNPHFRKGSDFISFIKNKLRNSFNPHFRKGSDFLTDARATRHTGVSIHTSAREVTQ